MVKEVCKCEGCGDFMAKDDAILIFNTFYHDTCIPDKKENALDSQVGGNHYKNFSIQPVVFCQKNKLNACETAIIKYACRHQNKDGIKDIKKIIHYAQLILKIEYGES